VFSQFVPVIGTYIAGALPIAIALIADPIDALWVLGVILVYQQVENYWFAPRITAQTMDIHPAVAFGGVIAGAALLGPVGALLALPAAATLQAFVSTYVTRHEVVESPLTRRQRPRPQWGKAIRSRIQRYAEEDSGDEPGSPS
jgi:predicted PurR-regulated permease PerM